MVEFADINIDSIDFKSINGLGRNIQIVELWASDSQGNLYDYQASSKTPEEAERRIATWEDMRMGPFSEGLPRFVFSNFGIDNNSLKSGTAATNERVGIWVQRSSKGVIENV